MSASFWETSVIKSLIYTNKIFIFQAKNWNFWFFGNAESMA